MIFGRTYEISASVGPPKILHGFAIIDYVLIEACKFNEWHKIIEFSQRIISPNPTYVAGMSCHFKYCGACAISEILNINGKRSITDRSMIISTSLQRCL